jgi:hypothetical protein
MLMRLVFHYAITVTVVMTVAASLWGVRSLSQFDGYQAADPPLMGEVVRN